MFTESILISLLYVIPILVHSVYNDTESNEEFVRKCCLRDIDDVIDDRQNRCDLESLNHTSAVMLYRSFGNTSNPLCCSVCSENTFELKVGLKETATKQQRENLAEQTNPRRFCFKRCISDGQTIRVSRKGKKNGARNDNNADDEDDKDEEKEEEERVEENDEEEEEEEEDANDSFIRNANKTGNCDSVFKSLNFWGANMVVFANIVYILPYTIVVAVYLTVLRKSTRAYHKAVICYNATQIVLNGILIGIGTCVLCHVSIYSNVYAILGLTIMFLTISSTSWLFVICIDMTLVITRFRWTSSNNTSQQEEKKKFVTYAGWTWGGSLLATAIAGIAELSPLLPISSPARPNFSRFSDGANLAVILYVATIPALTCIANTALFCYTSYKMILIRKSTRLATENCNFKINTMKTRYFIFVKLYLLMDAPWLTSALAAAFSDLWVLKFLRMIQPILMLCAILPPGTMSRTFASIRSFWKPKRDFETDHLPPTP